jgi:hypothetical protein
MTAAFSVAAQNAALDGIEAAIGASAVLKVRTGAVPASCAAADTGTVLSTVSLPSDWMAAAAELTKYAQGNWIDPSADASGTPGHFRVYDATGTTCHMQGALGQDFSLSAETITFGESVTINRFQLGTVTVYGITGVRTYSGFTAGKTIKNVTTDFGANNLDKTGATDNQSKLAAIIASIGSNVALYFPAGVYKHSGVLEFSGKSGLVLYGDGQTTELRATDKTATTLRLASCTNARVSDLWLSCPTGSARYDAGNDRRGLEVVSCTGVEVNNVKVSGVENAACLFYASTGLRITHNTVDHNFSDNFHFTDGCSDVIAQFNQTLGGGDDSFASIGAGAGNSNIHFLDNWSEDSGASGFSFEGTTSGTALRNRIYRSAVAGCRIDTPSSYPGAVNDTITAMYNYFEGCRTNTGVGHPCCLIFAEAAYVRNVIFSRNTIVNPNTAVGIQVFGTSSSLNVTAAMNDNVMTNTTGAMTTGFSIGSFVTFSSRTGNTLNGIAA